MVSMAVGDRISRMVVEPASSSDRSGFSSPNNRRLMGFCLGSVADTFFLARLTGALVVFFFCNCVTPCINKMAERFRPLNKIGQYVIVKKEVSCE